MAVSDRVKGVAMLALLLGLPGCRSRDDQPAARGATAASASGDSSVHEAAGADSAAHADAAGPVHVVMRNVFFHLPHDIELRIRSAVGTVRAASESQMILFDDPSSFVVRIDTGEVALSMEALGRLMNDWVFAYDGAPLRELRFEARGEGLRLRGKLDAFIDVSFEIDATPAMTPEGEIRMHPDRIRTGGAIGSAIRSLLGLDLDEVVDLEGARGIRAEGNDLFLDPGELLPPPRIEGHIVEIAVEDDVLVQRFETPSSRAGQADNGELSSNDAGRGPPAPDAATDGNYMHFTGGTLGFGKLRMVDADLRVIDMDADDPFDFSIEHYQEQLIAGLSRTTPRLGLDVWMPDLDDLRRPQ
ncbi:MAG: hypothetical protein ACREL7_15415 [Longimicrobiales bacterium]